MSGHVTSCTRGWKSTIDAAAAGTLMAHLPTVGWADVAIKADIVHPQQQMDLRFAAVEQRMDQRFEAADHKLEAMGSRIVGELRKEINDALVSQTRVFANSLVGAVMGTGSLVLAAVRLG